MKFAPPTLEEVKARAVEIRLPVREAEKFWNHWDAKGWMMGKVKMKKWRSALATWKLRWEEWRTPDTRSLNKNTQAILWQRELEAVQKQMDAIRNSYSEHQSWAVDDRDRWIKLRERKRELKKLLGIQV